MRVLRYGNDKKFTRTCVDCDTKFEYTKCDLIDNCLQCPYCGSQIKHKSKQLSKISKKELSKLIKIKAIIITG